jgi:hypothetical protein
MSVEQVTQVIPATGQIPLPPGNFFLLISTTASLNVRIQKAVGNSEGCNGIQTSLLLVRVDQWQQLVLIGAAGTSVTYIYGVTTAREDTTDIRAQIAILSGTSAIAETPAATLSTPATVVVATASATTVAANLARRRITVSNNSSSTGSVFAQTVAAGAGRGLEIQPGQSLEIRGTYTFDLRNDSGGNCTISTFEES